MSDLSTDQVELCYSEFRKHCIHLHDLKDWDKDAYMHLNLEEWTLTLIKTENFLDFPVSEHSLESALSVPVIAAFLLAVPRQSLRKAVVGGRCTKCHQIEG